MRKSVFSILQTLVDPYSKPLLTLCADFWRGNNLNWKYLTGFFLGVSGIRLGKLTLALDFKPQNIDHDLPPFHKELPFLELVHLGLLYGKV